MTNIEYDGSFEGLFSVVFDIYAHKLQNVKIYQKGERTSPLFGEKVAVQTDDEKAKRVWRKLNELIGREGLHTLRQVYLSELPEMAQVIVGCIRYAIAQNTNVLSDYGHPDVLRLKQIAKMVGREKHRMEAFVRFQLTADDIFYSVIEPDFNVLPLILSHFESRYADQRWLIYDSKRKYGIYYDLETTEFVDLTPSTDLSKPTENILNESETKYQVLWKDYFHSTNIKSRKNMKLHLQHVPRRYWKYLTEKK